MPAVAGRLRPRGQHPVRVQDVQGCGGAGRNVTFGTTGVGTGSQLAQTVLFKQADVKGTDIPFDSGKPALTAVLGNQVELATIQLGEAMPQIQAGKVSPLLVFSEERNSFLPDTPAAKEAGYDVPVAQYRAVAAPKGTPADVKEKLLAAFQETFESDAYREFNKKNSLTPKEVSGAEVVTDPVRKSSRSGRDTRQSTRNWWRSTTSA